MYSSMLLFIIPITFHCNTRHRTQTERYTISRKL